jgi:hypothetical protein
MKLNFRLVGKIGLLLVIFGFFMPISCEMNGFQIADIMMNYGNTSSALMLYVLFLSALAGVIIGIVLLMGKNVSPIIDWITLIICIGSGLIVFLGSLESDSLSIQTGAYVIVFGWIAAILAQIISKIKNET